MLRDYLIIFALIGLFIGSFFDASFYAAIVGGVVGFLFFLCTKIKTMKTPRKNISVDKSKPKKATCNNSKPKIKVLDEKNEDGSQQVLISTKHGVSIGALHEDGAISIKAGSDIKRHANADELRQWLEERALNSPEEKVDDEKTKKYQPKPRIKVLDIQNNDGDQQVVIRYKGGVCNGALHDDGTITVQSGADIKHYANMDDLERNFDPILARNYDDEINPFKILAYYLLLPILISALWLLFGM